MPQIRTRREETYQCWCVIVENEKELSCNGSTTGPDDPFCETCTDRHPHLGVEVAERDPRQY